MKTNIFKVAIAIASFFSFTDNIMAQKGFQIGAEGTPQLSWIINKDDNDNKKFEYKTTFNSSFGITGEYGFTENMGIAINVLYSFQGQRFKLNDVERIKKIEYVKIPLMFAYNYELSSSVIFMGKIGPQLGLLTKARLTDKDGNNIVSDQKAAYEDFDIGAVAYAGVGYKINENLCIHANLRFDYAFTDAENKDYKHNINNPLVVSNGNGTSNTSRAIANNMTAGLTFGVRYLFKTK